MMYGNTVSGNTVSGNAIFKTVENLPGDFDSLSELKLEPICKGRSAAIMTDGSIVRSTSVYQQAPYKWANRYLDICKDQKANNAMIELYTDEYRIMAYHSDLALDLVPDSEIGIYSYYPDNTTERRKLVIKDKSSGEIKEIIMHDRTAVIFDTNTNSKFVHKIVGRGGWLGITMRLSNTYIKDIKGVATKEERVEFLKLRKKENISLDFTWGLIPYTLSPSDLMPVQDSLLDSS
jgi:hypothetical protein